MPGDAGYYGSSAPGLGRAFLFGRPLARIIHEFQTQSVGKPLGERVYRRFSVFSENDSVSFGLFRRALACSASATVFVKSATFMNYPG